MPNTDSRSWPMPTVGGSAGTWGSELNQLFDDNIEPDVDAIEATADGALQRSGGVLTGEVEIKTERYATTDKTNLSGSVTFNLSDSDYQFGVVNGDITSITISNWPASGKAEFFTLELQDGGAHTITWPASIIWDGDVEPTLRTSGVDILVFVSRDNGSTVRGMHSGSFGS